MRELRFITKVKLVAGTMMVLAVAGTWFYWKYNIDWSARIAWGEARGEPDGGMQAVLNVMANRKSDPRFPKSLSSVAMQPYQFSAYNDFDPNRVKLEAVDVTDPNYAQARRLALFAHIGLLPDITGGATYFHSVDVERPYYLQDAKVSAQIGGHIFYVVGE